MYHRKSRLRGCYLLDRKLSTTKELTSMASQYSMRLWFRGVRQVLLAVPLAAISLNLWSVPSQAEVSITLQTTIVQPKYPSSHRSSYQRRYYRLPQTQYRSHPRYNTIEPAIVYPSHQVITPVTQPIIIHSPASSGTVVVVPTSSSVQRVNSGTTDYPQVIYPRIVYPQIIYPQTTYPQSTIRRTTSVQIRF